MTIYDLIKFISDFQRIEIAGDYKNESPSFVGIKKDFLSSENFKKLIDQTINGIFSKVDENGQDYILIYYDDYKFYVK